MPTRLLYEKICDSVTLANLTADEERLFHRLVVKADDYGRFHAHPSILLGSCFPLLIESIGVDQVHAWRDRLAEVGLIEVYTVEGREYLRFLTWGNYQRQRNSKAKFPNPEPSPPSGDNSPQLAADCGSRVVKTRGPVADSRRPVADSRRPVRAEARETTTGPPPATGNPESEPFERTTAPEAMVPSAENYAIGATHGMTTAEVDAQARAMLARYRQKKERRGDWQGTLGGWLRNAPRFEQQRAPPPSQNGQAAPGSLAARMKSERF